jgi:broad specificity phosphatase PhoE
MARRTAEVRMLTLRGPAELVLVRHAESRGNVADRTAREAGAERLELDVRDADMPLSELGEEQAAALGRQLAALPPGERPTAIFSSPYRRAVDTATAAAHGAELGERLQLDERVRERELGAFDGLTGAGIRRLHPEEAERRRWLGKFLYRPPGGESWADVTLRVRQFLLDLSLDPAPTERVWVFTHQAVILAFRVALEGLTEQQILEIDRNEPLPNCSLTRFRGDGDGRWELVGFAETEHLDGSAPETRERPATDRATEDAARGTT